MHLTIGRDDTIVIAIVLQHTLQVCFTNQKCDDRVTGEGNNYVLEPATSCDKVGARLPTELTVLILHDCIIYL